MSPGTTELMQMAAEMALHSNAAGPLSAMKEMTEQYRKAETADRQRRRPPGRFEEENADEGTSEGADAPGGEAAGSNLGADFEGAAAASEVATEPPPKGPTKGSIKAGGLKKVAPGSSSSSSSSRRAAPAWAAVQLKKTKKTLDEKTLPAAAQDGNAVEENPILALKLGLKKVTPGSGVGPIATVNLTETPMVTAGLKKVTPRSGVGSMTTVNPTETLMVTAGLKKVTPGSGVDTPRGSAQGSVLRKDAAAEGQGRGPLSADKGPPSASARAPSTDGRQRSGSRSSSRSSRSSGTSSSNTSSSTITVSSVNSAVASAASFPSAKEAITSGPATSTKGGGFLAGLKKRAGGASLKAAAMRSPAKPAFAAVALKKTGSRSQASAAAAAHDPEFGASSAGLPPLDVGAFPPLDAVAMVWERMRQVVAADGGDGEPRRAADVS
jgi:hypothetical protein